MHFNVKLNWTNKQFRTLSKYLFIIALVGFAFSYIINLPVQKAPSEIAFLYYFEILPRWILYIFTGTLIAFLLSLLTFDIRRNTSGVLRFYTDSISISTRKKSELIIFDQLKKITFIVHPMRIRPYRVEFIYQNDKFKRIIIKNESEFLQIIKNIAELKPENLEIDFGPFESIKH